MQDCHFIRARQYLGVGSNSFSNGRLVTETPQGVQSQELAPKLARSVALDGAMHQFVQALLHEGHCCIQGRSSDSMLLAASSTQFFALFRQGI
jgi:hypothetical protein